MNLGVPPCIGERGKTMVSHLDMILTWRFFPNKMWVYHRYIGYVETLGLIDDGLKEIVTGSLRFFEFAK